MSPRGSSQGLRQNENRNSVVCVCVSSVVILRFFCVFCFVLTVKYLQYNTGHLEWCLSNVHLTHLGAVMAAPAGAATQRGPARYKVTHGMNAAARLFPLAIFIKELLPSVTNN